MVFNCVCSLRSVFVAILQRIGILSLNNHQNNDIGDSTCNTVESQPDETITMASSSSPFVPSKEPQLHEVFISFRGEDTRNNFVSHLHNALVDRGIRTYLDEENLEQGQTIRDKLMQAIQESSIAVVVLSTNYGSSTWCLNELVKIMDCTKSGLHVFPIFYHVDPSDVRKQKNSFFEAFAKHEVNFKDDAETVKLWRKALQEVADLVGEDIRGKNELSCVKNIADKILRKLPVKASQFGKFVVGIESRVLEIKKMMCSKPDGVIFIGLWGMGGIGKTTTARTIFEECKSEFGGSCFLQDVRQYNNKLEKLQEKLLSNVLKTKEFEGISDVVEGSSIIQERLQFKKILLVIDDVDDIEQLHALAKECDWFGKGSVIIITTRDNHILVDDYIKKYNVQTLPVNEALHLLCLHAFRNDHPPKDYKDLSLQVLRYAGGLPLALKVLGDHLCRQEISFWKSTLIRLKDVPEDKIIFKLQISFDGLNVLEQDIFLDIACFFGRAYIQHLEKRLQSFGLHYEEGIHVLLRKSLIYFNDDYIEMHDLLQEMGCYIVRQRANRDVKRYNRLWLKNDIIEVLSDITMVSSEVEMIRMPGDTGYFCDSFLYGEPGRETLVDREAALIKMNNLRFLELCAKGFVGNCDFLFPQSVGQRYNYKLRWFSLCHYQGKSLPKSFRPINIVHLCLRYSEIEETPDFSYMSNLEELDLRDSTRLVHVHPSLGDLKKIKRLLLENCVKLEEFPKINQTAFLEILNFKNTNLEKFPEIYGNLDSLRELNTSGTFISVLLTSMVGNATGLQELELECRRPYNEQFRSLEVVEGSFPGLVSLQMTGSGIVRTLDFSHLPYLKRLDLSGSEKLEEVHASLGVHKRIKSINLAECSKLEDFPRIIDMNSLKKLDLSFTSLESFPEIYGNLDSLMELNIEGTSINGLPTSMVGNATGLQELELECRRPYNEQFRSLEVVEGSFPGLVSLQITGSGIVRTLDFSHLPYLETLDLSDSKELEEVHASLGVHKKIISINLAKCSKLRKFPKIIDMNSLEELELSFTSLKSFPEIYGNLDSLMELNVEGTSINGLPTSMVGNATGLQELELECQRPYNEQFRSLEVVEGSFPGLVSLQITGSGIVRTLDFSHLPYLKRLDLSGSEKLEEVHASLGVHKMIKSINLAECSKLEDFPRIIDMNSLEQLDLSFTSLKSFPEMTGNVSRLFELCLEETKITTLPWSIGRATGLDCINMDGCEYLLTLPITSLGLQLHSVFIRSPLLKYFTDETGHAVELHSSQRKREKQLIVSEGMRQFSDLHIYFHNCRSLKGLPDSLLARVWSLSILECPSLTSWICFHLVELLSNNQHLCNLELHQHFGKPHVFLQAFTEWELVSNMLRKREKSFTVYVPGSEIPSWFKYRINRHSATAFLPPLAEWNADNLKGIVVSGTNDVPSTSDNNCYGLLKRFYVLIMYIPIKNIRDWEGQKECPLFELPSSGHFGINADISRWGLSLVYSEDEDHPCEVLIEKGDHPDSEIASFRVKMGKAE